MIRLPLAFGVNVVELHPVAELVTLQVQELRRAALVPPCSTRSAQYQGSLQRLDERLERDAGRGHHALERLVHALAERGVARRAWPRPELQVVRLQHLGLLQQHRALHEVLELTDVAGPGIVVQHLLGGLADAAERLLELLRDRREDILPLTRLFLERFSKQFKKPFRGIAESAEQVLNDYPWPGNIRELKNLMERTVLLEKAEVLEAHHLKLASRPRASEDTTIGQRVDDALQGVIPTTGIAFETLVESLERALIVRASYATKWNQSRTAELLNLKRDKLRYRMKLYDIHPEGQGQTNHPNAA